MLWQRALSALVLAPPALWAAWVGAWPFAALIGLAGAVAAWEWSVLCRGRCGRAGLVLMAMAVLAALAGGAWPLVGLAVVALAVASVMGMPAVVGRSNRWMVAGALYVGLPSIALVWLRHEDRALLIWLLVLVWTTDIAAFAVGKTLGGPKLLPSVSPKKTWSGLAGGVAGAMVVGVVTAVVVGQPVLALACLSGGLAVVAQAGDLAESWVKRYFGVKDSSRIIPGHGGVLDRVDGLLAVAPVVALLHLADGLGFAHG